MYLNAKSLFLQWDFAERLNKFEPSSVHCNNTTLDTRRPKVTMNALIQLMQRATHSLHSLFCVCDIGSHAYVQEGVCSEVQYTQDW